MKKKLDEPNELRRTLSLNIKKQRKILGLTQEKLAEAANLSPQTINDIEGCRMWVSDKTIVKLAQVLYVDIHQLFTPITAIKTANIEPENLNEYLLDLEDKIIRYIHAQFEASKVKGTKTQDS
jgi:transcriptional regulator with XRE-family HTH domain